MSLDGFIAAPEDNLSFLSVVEKEGEDYGYSEFVKGIDTVIMGRKTYEWVISHVPEFIHANKVSYIITRTPKPSVGNTNFYSGNLRELILTLKTTEGKNIFIDGGAEIVNLLLQDNLIDEFVISVIPVLLGEGIRLFNTGFPAQNLKLLQSRQYEKGLVQLHYCKTN